MDQESIASFKEKLNSQHQWPGKYTFKFIVPIAKIEEVKVLFPSEDILERSSSKGTYKSLTIKAHIQSSDEVVSLYIEAKKIEGIISL